MVRRSTEENLQALTDISTFYFLLIIFESVESFPQWEKKLQARNSWTKNSSASLGWNNISRTTKKQLLFVLLLTWNHYIQPNMAWSTAELRARHAMLTKPDSRVPGNFTTFLILSAFYLPHYRWWIVYGLRMCALLTRKRPKYTPHPHQTYSSWSIQMEPSG